MDKNNVSLPMDQRVVIARSLRHLRLPSLDVQSPALSCKEHEEADTRMFAYATDCVQTCGCNVVVLQTTDTDIFVNAMYYCVQIH